MKTIDEGEQGNVSRIVILTSPATIDIPKDHKKGESLSKDTIKPMLLTQYDFQTMHWDQSQQKYYYESMNNAGGPLWHSGKGGLEGEKTKIFLVVDIPKEHEDSPLLPRMPGDKEK